MPITIRKAESADAATIVDFNCRLAEESEGKTLDRERIGAGVAAALADRHKALYYLACDGDQVVGQLMITWEWSDWRNGWFWWIQSVYVRPEARRRGVFRALFEHVLHSAKGDPEVIGLRLYVEENNHRAQQTYRKLGLTPTHYGLMERYPL